jgi:hypothetical protein
VPSKTSSIPWRTVLLFSAIVTAPLVACADSVAIAARDLSGQSPNIVPVEKRWDGLVVCHGNDGMQQWTVEIKSPGPHFLHFQFASGEKRPVDLFINDKKQRGRYLKAATGGFFAWDLDWETCGPFDLAKGQNTIRVECARRLHAAPGRARGLRV